MWYGGGVGRGGGWQANAVGRWGSGGGGVGVLDGEAGGVGGEGGSDDVGGDGRCFRGRGARMEGSFGTGALFPLSSYGIETGCDAV